MTESKNDPVRETAILGGGCFWCLEAVFDLVAGVDEVVPGYCGGHVGLPGYRDVCSARTGHAEGVEVVVRSAEDGHPRGVRLGGPEALPRTEAPAERRVSRKAIVTRVERAPRFWPAEPEHHDYYVNNSDQPYCQYVVAPKITKFRSHFDLRRWPEGSR